MKLGNRSKAIAKAMNSFMAKHDMKKEILAGTIIFRVLKEKGTLRKKMYGIREHYREAIQSSILLPLDKGVIEVLVVQGKQCILQKLKNGIKKIEGVSDCKMQLVKNWSADEDE